MLQAELHERHFGNIEFITLTVDSLINLSQIRDTANARFDDIKESIDHEDLDNPINVARVTAVELQAYINFTNHTWGNDVTLADLSGKQQEDGLYNLIVAGHTRAEAVRQLATEYSDTTGKVAAYTVLCKKQADTSVEAIVSTQAKENLHASTAVEREAIAIVELYYHGLGTKWQDSEEFRASQNGRINRRILHDALAFAELPVVVRRLVFSRHIPYRAGVGLARAKPVIASWLADEAGLEPDGQTADSIEAAVADRLLADTAYIYNRRLNSTAAARYIEAFVAKMKADIAQRAASQSEEDLTGFEETLFTMMSPGQQAAAIRRRERKRLATILREAINQPMAASTELVLTLAGASGADVTGDTDQPSILEHVIRDAEAAHALLVKDLGNRATEVNVRII